MFAVRYSSSNVLSESLLSSQMAADERVTRLREEYEELHESMGSFGLSLLQSGNTIDSNGEYGLPPVNENEDVKLSPESGSASAAASNKSAMVDSASTRVGTSKRNSFDNAGTADGAVSTKAAAASDKEGQESIFIDEQTLVEQERRLHQLESAMDKNQLLLNEAKQGIRHILNTVHVNSKLLHSLPKVSLPGIGKFYFHNLF